MSVYAAITSKMQQGKKQFAILVDPDKHTLAEVEHIATLASRSGVDYFFVGGSLLINNQLDQCINMLKENADIPVVLFPGNTLQMSWKADAILFLSLISGRNPEMLIGRHVIAAPYLKLSPLEVISTGYMLVESGKPTAVSYMSNSSPIPADKNDIAMCTAMAGEMLGLKLIYLDAGSGALNTVPEIMVDNVKKSISVPLIIGGGIRTPGHAAVLCDAGADLIVIGNVLEKNVEAIQAFSDAIHKK
jgi:putative glycerol-1-phosphate prenyltransferase